jgi:hypothetical protein
MWRAYGPDHPDLTNRCPLARLLRRTGGLEEAESLVRECLRIRTVREDVRRSAVLELRDELVLTQLARSEWTAAEAFARESLDLFPPALGPRHPAIAYTKAQLGAAIAGAGRYEEAEPILLEGWESLAGDDTLWPDQDAGPGACPPHEAWRNR